MHNNLSFETIEPFCNLSKEAQELLSEICQVKTYKKDDIIYYEGDYGNQLSYLVSGKVKFFKVNRFGNEVFLYTLNYGIINEFCEIQSFQKNYICSSHCGLGIHCGLDEERLVLKDVPKIRYSQNAQSLQECVVFNFPYAKVYSLLGRSVEIMQLFFDEFIRKICQIQSVLNRELILDSTSKVAQMLDCDLEIFNDNKKQDIAYFLNIQPETLSRILKKLIREGIIIQDNTKITVLDPQKLKEIYL